MHPYQSMWCLVSVYHPIIYSNSSKKMKTVKTILAVLLLSMAATGAQAQSIKDIFSGVVNAVTGNKVSASSLVGTWKYSAPACEFESDNLLAKAGGAAASKKVTSKLTSIYTKVGMQNVSYTFKEDGTYTSTLKGHTTSGTYTLDESNKTLTLKTSAGVSLKTYVSVSSSEMSMLFESGKLMDGLKTISSLASKVNTTASLLSTLMNSYDGMRLGFKLKKQ